MSTGSPTSPSPSLTAPKTLFDYHRTIVGYHGTRKQVAADLVDGAPFGPSTNDDDWLGHGIYFWEYAPQQAWWWARRRYGEEAAVIGSMIRIGRCFDLFDPANTALLKDAHDELQAALRAAGATPPKNYNTHKYLDCAVFNYLYKKLDKSGYVFDSCRAVFVPLQPGKGLPRLWTRSGVLEGGHVQLSVREPQNILAVWSVKRDGRYGRDK